MIDLFVSILIGNLKIRVFLLNKITTRIFLIRILRIVNLNHTLIERRFNRRTRNVLVINQFVSDCVRLSQLVLYNVDW